MNSLPKIKLSQKETRVKIAEDKDFFELFQVIEKENETCFLFESLGEDGKFSRYSIIGFSPMYIVSARGNKLYMSGNSFTVENPYYTLRELMPETRLNTTFAGGLVGYLGYDATNYFEPTLHIKTHPYFDTFKFGVYTDGLLLDKVTNELIYFFHDQNREEYIKKCLKKTITKTNTSIKYQGQNINKQEHKRIVENVKDLIAAGNIFQCEVGLKNKYEINGNSLHIYSKLRDANPSPFMYFLKFKNQHLIGASPELLFSLNNKKMTTRPLAGTTKRGKTEQEDKQLARELLRDPKEIAEHSMLVDLHRNDLGKVAKFGTVKISDLMNIKRFSHVQHIASEITGEIKPNEDMFSGVAANFPAGTLTGAPKIEAMKIIENNETEARGPYGGGVGYFGFNGDCEFAIAIRSLFIHENESYSQTSGGIVHDSIPEKEYEEIQKKSAAMKGVLGL